jgi:hypothetical protein
VLFKDDKGNSGTGNDRQVHGSRGIRFKNGAMAEEGDTLDRMSPFVEC